MALYGVDFTDGRRKQQMLGHCSMAYVTNRSHTHIVTISTIKYMAGERQFLLK